jgi:pyruvate ferredoxin oxidoreductase beta subunit
MTVKFLATYRATVPTTLVREDPVEDYLRPQKRFAHLFGTPPDTARLARIQAAADRNIARFNLLGN